MDNVALWPFVIQGGALVVLAVLVLIVGPRVLDRRVEAVEHIAELAAEAREKDRELIKQAVRTLDRIADCLDLLTAGSPDKSQRSPREGSS